MKKKDEKKLSVEYEDTEKAYEYLPYGSKIRNEQEVWGDTYVKGTGKTTYTTSFCELSEADWQERTGKKCEEILRKTSEYDLFVSKQYLKIDAEQKKNCSRSHWRVKLSLKFQQRWSNGWARIQVIVCHRERFRGEKNM